MTRWRTARRNRNGFVIAGLTCHLNRDEKLRLRLRGRNDEVGDGTTK